METMRIAPPDVRHALTQKVSIQNFTLYITVGFYENKQPCEIFVTVSKEGSTLAGLMDAISIGISFCLQYGTPWSILAKKYKHTAFEPSDDKHASIMDLLSETVTELVEKFGGKPEFGPKGQE